MKWDIKGEEFWDSLPRWYKHVIIGTTVLAMTLGRWFIDELLSWTPLFWGGVLIASNLYCQHRDARLRRKALEDPKNTAEAAAKDHSSL